jgi:hypothetical protein
MSNRIYRLVYGAMLLCALYLDLYPVLYALIGLAVFEAVTNVRVPGLVSRLRFGNEGDPKEGSLGIQFVERCSFEAERGWRLTVASLLSVSILAFPETLWFVPWFMGFAILGAGVSGVCPMFLALKWAGLR